jgi:hypothetical protein
MKYEVRSIDPMSAGKMLIVIGLVVGLVVGFLMMIIVWAVGALSSTEATPLLAAMMLGVVALIGTPVVGAVVGFLTGYLGGGVYNFFANWYGGMTVELDETNEKFE